MSHHITITKFSIRYIFSLFVVNARHEKKLTQEDLAALVHTSRRWIQLIESGKRMPSLWLAVNLIIILEIDPAALLQATANQRKSEASSDVSVPGR